MQDKLEILFQDNQGSWHNSDYTIKLTSKINEEEAIEDLKSKARKHKEYYKYFIRKTKNNTQSIIASEYIEQDGYKKMRRK